MTEKPILFSAPMVRAILSGDKTQTRRILKASVPQKPAARCHEKHAQKHPEPYLDSYCNGILSEENPRRMSQNWCWWQVDDRQCLPTFKVPYVPGDRLWVRESWSAPYRYAEMKPRDMGGPVWCWADGDPSQGDWTQPMPSIHMPRWASRITLLVTDVRVQRLQDISEEDAKAEGLQYRMDWLPQWRGAENLPWCSEFPRDAFRELWDNINGDGAWNSNPWVYAVTFSVASAQLQSEERSDTAPNLVNALA